MAQGTGRMAQGKAIKTVGLLLGGPIGLYAFTLSLAPRAMRLVFLHGGLWNR